MLNRQSYELTLRQTIGLPAMYTQDGICRSWWPHDLCAKRYRLISSRRDLRGQNSQGRQACRLAGSAADEVRVRHQPESGPADRSDDPAKCAGKSG